MATEIILERHECNEQLRALQLLYNEEHERADRAQAELEQLKALEDYPTFVHYIEGYRKRTAEMRKAQEEAKRLQAALDSMTNSLLDANREIKRLREALKWYADEGNYTWSGTPGHWEEKQYHRNSKPVSIPIPDMGQRARTALEGEEWVE